MKKYLSHIAILIVASVALPLFVFAQGQALLDWVTSMDLGSAALVATSTLLQQNRNLSDAQSTSSVRTNLGLTDTATLASSTWLKAALTSLNGSTSSTQTFATTSDTNFGLSIATLNGIHTLTALWIGTLADNRITSAATWNAKQNNITFPLPYASTTHISFPIPYASTTGFSFASTTTNNGFAIASSSGTWTFNFPGRIDKINSLATTTGNLIVASSSPNGYGTLSVGANGRVLTASSTAANGVSWEAAAAGGSGNATVSHLVGDAALSKTMTNIGATYKDIYAALTDLGYDKQVIDFEGAASFKIVFFWDYVGAGTQQVRWVNQADNNNVLYESATFTADQDGTASAWTTLPAAFSGAVVKTIEWQGKSTTAADDPVAKGFRILLK